MNKVSKESFYPIIYDSTWIGLLQLRLAKTQNIQELSGWSTNLKQSHIDLPSNVKKLLTSYLSLIQKWDQLFKDFETEQARFLQFKKYLIEKTMEYFPKDSKVLRQKYIDLFMNLIPDFTEEWNEDVDFREGDDSLIMLFVFLNCMIPNSDEKTLIKIFQIIETGLKDPEELVQAELTRGILINLLTNNFVKEKYAAYLSESVSNFCKKLGTAWEIMNR